MGAKRPGGGRAKVPQRAHARRAAAAKAIRASEARMRLSLDAANLAYWDYDIATGRNRWGVRLATLLGVPPERAAAVTQDWLSVIHSEDRPRVLAEFQATVEGRADYDTEFRVLHTDGSVRWFAAKGKTLRHSNGTPSRVVGIVQDITERKQTEERLKLLAAEVDHRAKNVLALVQIMLRQTKAASVEEFAAAAQGRVAALAHAHSLLSQSRWMGAELAALIEVELAPYLGARGRVLLSGPVVTLSPRAAQSISLSLHELATNAIKHGSLSVSSGRLQIAWSLTPDDGLALQWTETGGPSSNTPVRRGFGIAVIEQSIHRQLEGEVRFHWAAEGLECTMRIPANSLSAIRG